MFELILAQWQAQDSFEIIAVVLAVAYLVLAIRQSIWCWPCAFVSTGIYVWLFFDVALFMESALNVFYLLMAIYGFYYWLKGREHAMPSRPVGVLALRWHATAILVIAVLIGISGLLLARYTPQAYPYADSFTSWTAVWATWLTARKVLENWWYWLVINVVSVWLFLQKELVLTALLFVIYIAMIPFGYLAWRRSFLRTDEQALPE